VKKIFALLLVMALMLSGTTAFAADAGSSAKVEQPAYTVTINEYDVYVSTRSTSDSELSRRGVSRSTAALIKSNAIEDELSKLSGLSVAELESLGYSGTQIILIQKYGGERIESNPQLRGIFADMTCNFYKQSASTSSLAVRVTWEWSNVPLLAGVAIKDIVGIRWQGTNNAGQPLNLALNSSGTSCSIQYYSRTGSYKSSSSATVSTDDPYGHAYARIPMSAGTGDSNGDYYAKKGTLITKVDRTGTNSIKEAAFVFGYGHTVISISPSLSLPVSFGIGFTTGVEEMCEEAIRMSSSGTITQY
jgi:hypothetical protein